MTMDARPKSTDDLGLASDDLLERKRLYAAEHLTRCQRIGAPLSEAMYLGQLRAVEDEINKRWLQWEEAAAARYDRIEGTRPAGAYR